MKLNKIEISHFFTIKIEVFIFYSHLFIIMSKRKATPSPTKTNKKAFRNTDLDYNDNTFQINKIICIILIIIILYYFILI